MRLLKLSIINVIIFCTFLSIGDAQNLITNGLVAYYPFNGNGNDLSGNSNNLSTAGYSFVTDQRGVASNAIYFNYGTPLEIPNSTSWDDNSFSVAVWVKLASSGVDANHWPQVTGKRADYSLGAGRWTLSAYGYGSNATNGWSFYAAILYVQNEIDYVSPSPADVWKHFCGTYDSGTTRLYINGVLVGQTTASGQLVSGLTRPIIIGGCGYHNAGNPSDDALLTWNGGISSYRYYNRALSSNEVVQLYRYEEFCSPHSAKASAVISGDGIASAIMTDYGCGYSNAPSVRIIGGGGTGALAKANMTNGIVTDLIITMAGSGYTNAPRIYIESPPYTPTVGISYSAVKVAQHVRVNHNYVLQSSPDLSNWTAVGPSFTATSEYVTNEFEIETYGRFFRLQEVP
jgi:hypothetical protein